MMATDSPPRFQVEEMEAAEPHRVTMRGEGAWDACGAYLFDVDGTLLRSVDRVHVHSFAKAAEDVTGERITLDGVTLHGGTDTAILAEAFAHSGVSAKTLEAHRRAILDRMAEIMEAQRTELRFRRMPGVMAMLQWLKERGAALGIATGNLERIGWAKIEACGLREWFEFGGFSDRFPARAELVGNAAWQARRQLRDADAKVCVVGDTPRDIEAAKANGLSVIAVATGNFPFDELDRLEPEVCCTSFVALMKTEDRR